jgi:hypothetical protein
VRSVRPRSTGTKPPELVELSIRSSDSRYAWCVMSSSTRFLICIRNDGYPASLETRKVYQELPDPDAEAQGR